jgi:glutathione S-transferase
MMMKLYHAPGSRSMRIYWLLEELGIDFELVNCELEDTPGFHDQDVPGGKFPALADGEVVMSESGAIIEYIIDRYDQGRLAPERQTPTWAEFLQWLHYAEGTAFPVLRGVANHTSMFPEHMRSPALLELETLRERAIIERVEVALVGRDYLLGQEFSAADIQLGSTIYMALPLGLIADDSHVKGWLNRLLQRPAAQKVLHE